MSKAYRSGPRCNQIKHFCEARIEMEGITSYTLQEIFRYYVEKTDGQSAQPDPAVQGRTEDMMFTEKYPIWGDTIPYNTGAPKKAVMEISSGPVLLSVIGGFAAIFSNRLAGNDRRMDSLTWQKEMMKGEAQETFSDRPYIIPRIVPGSRHAVLIAPGGGFCYKAMEEEGERIASFLNDAGISAFILWYRLNPYEFPVPYLDMQRAVRYIRFHAADFGVQPQTLGVMGFSAGGYVAGACCQFLGNAPVSCPGYVPDEVDRVSAIPAFLGMLYPVVQFDTNPNMLSIMLGDRIHSDSDHEKLFDEYSLVRQMTPTSVPCFLCYGTKDPLRGMTDYNRRMQELNIPHRTLVLDGAGHGFGDCSSTGKQFAFWKKEYIDWIRTTVE